MLEKIKKELTRLETIMENIKNLIKTEQDKQIKDIFIKLVSPIERMPLFKKLDAEIRQIDEGVSFRTTENGLVYEINDQVFTTIFPQVSALKVEYAIPGGWDSCKLIDDTEIDGAMVLVKESCDYIKKKRNKNK